MKIILGAVQKVNKAAEENVIKEGD